MEVEEDDKMGSQKDTITSKGNIRREVKRREVERERGKGREGGRGREGTGASACHEAARQVAEAEGLVAMLPLEGGGPPGDGVGLRERPNPLRVVEVEALRHHVPVVILP